MSILDCSSIITARTTVAEILGMTESELLTRLRAIEIPKFEEPRDYLVRALLGVEVDRLPSPNAIHWFHASRVLDPESFRREGILTKATMGPRLRALLAELGEGISSSGSSPFGFSAAAKLGINDEGPFAFLIRTVAIHAPGANHEYTKAPESVQDIAGHMVGMNVHLLVERFQAQTQPCIVAFRAAGASRHVAHAIWYIHLVERGLPDVAAGSIANTCYSGRGNAVPPSDVLSVEVL